MHTVFQRLPLLHMHTKMPPTSFDGLRRRGPGTESVWQSIVEAHLSDAAARHTRPAAPAAACGRSCERKSASHASFVAYGNAAVRLQKPQHDRTTEQHPPYAQSCLGQTSAGHLRRASSFPTCGQWNDVHHLANLTPDASFTHRLATSAYVLCAQLCD